MNAHFLIRKSHRYLGLLIGIQFLIWTAGGLYFAWTDIDEIHGDHLRKSPAFLKTTEIYATPSSVLANLAQAQRVDSVHSIHLIPVNGKAVYQIAYFSGHTEGTHHHLYYALADAYSGKLRGPLDEKEAVQIAADNLVKGAKVKEVKYIEYTDGHHEYRERPLPAWAISFDQPSCTVYVSAERGTYQTIRHDGWRIFDFLWMGHTMDYQNRDDFNNWLLRIFSVFGLATVLSGFTLFFISMRFKKV